MTGRWDRAHLERVVEYREPVTPPRPRWPLILAIVVVIGAVVAVSIAASRREPGPASTAPTLSGTLRATSVGHAQRDELSVGVPLTALYPATLGGLSTWYCGHGSACTRGYGPSDLVGAIDPTLGIGKGELVTVRHGGNAVVVRIVDVCQCVGRRLIDLTSGAFARLAPLSRGVIPISLEVGSGRLPPTDTVE